MMRLTCAGVAILAGVFFGPTAQAYEAPWCAVIELSKGSAYWDCQYRSFDDCYRRGIFWLAIAASAMQVRIMSAASQKKSAMRNAAPARSSGTTGYVVTSPGIAARVRPAVVGA
jgi:hypothetical protein